MDYRLPKSVTVVFRMPCSSEVFGNYYRSQGDIDFKIFSTLKIYIKYSRFLKNHISVLRISKYKIREEIKEK